MRTLTLLLMLLLAGCSHGSYHHSGWHSHGTSHHHDTIERPTRDATPALTTLESVRRGRIEGERKVRESFRPREGR